VGYLICGRRTQVLLDVHVLVAGQWPDSGTVGGVLSLRLEPSLTLRLYRTRHYTALCHVCI